MKNNSMSLASGGSKKKVIIKLENFATLRELLLELNKNFLRTT